jgi:hypothetical protein
VDYGSGETGVRGAGIAVRTIYRASSALRETQTSVARSDDLGNRNAPRPNRVTETSRTRLDQEELRPPGGPKCRAAHDHRWGGVVGTGRWLFPAEKIRRPG